LGAKNQQNVATGVAFMAYECPPSDRTSMGVPATRGA